MLCVLEARAHGRTMIQHSQAADLKLPALNAAAPSPVQVSGPAGHSDGKPLDHPSVPTLCVKNSSWKEKVHVFTASNQTCLRRVHFHHGPGGVSQCLLPHTCCPRPAASAKPDQERHPQSQGLEGSISATGGKKQTSEQTNKRTTKPNQTKPNKRNKTPQKNREGLYDALILFQLDFPSLTF